jgi:hypothetical protein
MKVPQEIYSEFQHLKDRVINLDKLIELEKQEPIPFFNEAKEALENKIESMFQDLKARPYSSPYQTEKQKVIEFLNSLYLPLKSEVCRDVVNKMFPLEDKDYSGSPRYFFIEKEDGRTIIAWNYRGVAEYLGVPQLNNEQAAEAFLKLMQTPLFEGDVTI